MASPNGILTLEDQWQAYARSIKLEQNQCSPEQWRETRRAFYGGAMVFYITLVRDLSMLGPDKAEDEMVRFDHQFRTATVECRLKMGEFFQNPS